MTDATTDIGKPQPEGRTPATLYILCLAIFIIPTAISLFVDDPAFTDMRDLFLKNGITWTIGLAPVIWAFFLRRKAPDRHKSHYTLLIRTFWIGTLYTILVYLFMLTLIPEVLFVGRSAPIEQNSGYTLGETIIGMALVLISLALVAAVTGWYLNRYFRGILAFMRGEPIKNPRTWLF